MVILICHCSTVTFCQSSPDPLTHQSHCDIQTDGISYNFVSLCVRVFVTQEVTGVDTIEYIHTTVVYIRQFLLLSTNAVAASPAGKPHVLRHFMYLYLSCSFAVPEVALVSFLNLKSSKAFNPVSSPPSHC